MGPHSFSRHRGRLLNLGMYSSGCKYRGINQSGAEYGNDWSGWTDQTFFKWPGGSNLVASTWASYLAYYASKGFNTIRLPISWERYQHTLLGAANTTYQANLVACVKQATAAGFYTMVDLHNYNRYASGTFTTDQGTTQTSAAFTQHLFGDGFLTNAHVIDVWTKLAALFVNDSHVFFNLMNESHDMPAVNSTAYVTAINAQIAAIRAVGANNLILVPNSRASDVDHWQQYAPNGGPLDSVAMIGITDSVNNFAHDMHAYWSPGGATPPRYTTYPNLLSEVTAWARTNKRKLFLSEMGADPGGSGTSAALQTALAYLNTNSDVWLGWTGWNLPPYQITLTTYVNDGSQMPDFATVLAAGTVNT